MLQSALRTKRSAAVLMCRCRWVDMLIEGTYFTGGVGTPVSSCLQRVLLDDERQLSIQRAESRGDTHVHSTERRRAGTSKKLTLSCRAASIVYFDHAFGQFAL